jgi:hypothetical protein
MHYRHATRAKRLSSTLRRPVSAKSRPVAHLIIKVPPIQDMVESKPHLWRRWTSSSVVPAASRVFLRSMMKPRVHRPFFQNKISVALPNGRHEVGIQNCITSGSLEFPFQAS